MVSVVVVLTLEIRSALLDQPVSRPASGTVNVSPMLPRRRAFQLRRLTSGSLTLDFRDFKHLLKLLLLVTTTKAVITTSLNHPLLSPAPEEPVDTPTVSAPEESADVPLVAPVDTVTAGLPVAPTNEPTDSGSGSGSGSGSITRTIPSSSGATAVATAIPVSGELDGGMTYYDRSRKSTDIKLSCLLN